MKKRNKYKEKRRNNIYQNKKNRKQRARWCHGYRLHSVGWWSHTVEEENKVEGERNA
jgi:hypothetical protein